MSEWGVVGVLIALAGFAATVVTPLIRLNTTMTRLAVLVEELSDKLAALEREASAVRAGLSGHETRLAILEMGGRTNGVVRPEH